MKKSILILFIVIASITKQSSNAQIITTVAGNGTSGYSGDGGQATNAELDYPDGVALDAFGNMLIGDNLNNRVRMVNTNGIISTFAGNGTQGYTGDGGAATAAELNYPTGVAFDAVGNVYIADEQNNVIRMVNTSGIITTAVGGGSSGLGDGGNATDAELTDPRGVALDVVGNLYISDLASNRIRKVTTSGIITTVAGNGTVGFSGDGGQATAAELYYPSGVAFDNFGNMYIADEQNNVIRMVNTSGIITTVVGSGTHGFSGDGGAATAAEIGLPYSVAFDAVGNLYIADNSNSRIRMVNTSGIITTVVGGGSSGLGDGGNATDAELTDPAGVALDAVGNLYIADFANESIRKVCYNSCPATTGIEQFTSNNMQVSIYPNPNNGSFVIEPNSTTKQTMQVYDVNGKLVLNQTISGKTTIDASSLNEGVYNISLLSNEGVINKRLVIVR
jgi:hypothetical protein